MIQIIHSDWIFNYLLYCILLNTVIIVIEKNNYIHVLLLLILKFILISILFISLNLEFLAFVFFAVYIGAVIVLFLFIIFLIDIKYYSSVSHDLYYGKTFLNPILWVIILLFYILLLHGLYYHTGAYFDSKQYLLNVKFPEHYRFIKHFWVEKFNLLENFDNYFYNTEYTAYTFIIHSYFFIRALGLQLYSVEISLFFLITLILLLAMMGAVLVGDIRKEKIKQQEPTIQTMKLFFFSFYNFRLYLKKNQNILNKYFIKKIK